MCDTCREIYVHIDNLHEHVHSLIKGLHVRMTLMAENMNTVIIM